MTKLRIVFSKDDEENWVAELQWEINRKFETIETVKSESYLGMNQEIGLAGWIDKINKVKK